MELFTKKRKKVCLVKTTELTKDGWETRYHTEINGSFIINSMSADLSIAEAFYQSVLKNGGANKVREYLKEEHL